MAKGRGSSNTVKKDNSIIGQVKEFGVDSQRFLNKCAKPDREGNLPFYIPSDIPFYILSKYSTTTSSFIY